MTKRTNDVPPSWEQALQDCMEAVRGEATLEAPEEAREALMIALVGGLKRVSERVAHLASNPPTPYEVGLLAALSAYRTGEAGPELVTMFGMDDAPLAFLAALEVEASKGASTSIFEMVVRCHPGWDETTKEAP